MTVMTPGSNPACSVVSTVPSRANVAPPSLLTAELTLPPSTKNRRRELPPRATARGCPTGVPGNGFVPSFVKVSPVFEVDVADRRPGRPVVSFTNAKSRTWPLGKRKAVASATCLPVEPKVACDSATPIGAKIFAVLAFEDDVGAVGDAGESVLGCHTPLTH